MDLLNQNADLFGDTRIVDVDDLTIIYNDNDQLQVNKITNINIDNYTINTNKLLFDNANTVLISNNDKQATESKDINNCLNDASISQIKIINLISDLQTLNGNFNDYYNKLYIDNLISNYYDKITSDGKYALITSLNNYVLSSYLTNNYYDKSTLDLKLTDYVLLTYLSSNYYNQSQSNNLYYNKTYIDTNFYNTTNTYSKSQVDTLLLNYYSKNLNLDLSNTYKIINSIDPINNQDLVTLNYLQNNFLSLSTYNTDNSNYTYDYAYNNWRDTTSGLLKINVFVPPSSNGSYYLSCVKTSLLNTFSWQLTSSLTLNPYSTFQTSNQNAFMKLEQLYNPIQTSSVANELIISNSYGSDYLVSIGYNSSGYFGTSNLGSRFGYIYCASSNLRLFTYNGSSVDTGLLITNSLIRLYRSLDVNSNVLSNCGNIFINSGSKLYTNEISTNTTSDITINNNLNLNSNNISNYNLSYRTMSDKGSSGMIAQQITTNNTYASFAVVDNTGIGIGMGLFKNSSGIYSCYLSTNKDFNLGNDSITYLKIPYNTTQATIYTQNTHLDLGVYNQPSTNTSGILYTKIISANQPTHSGNTLEIRGNMSVLGTINTNNNNITVGNANIFGGTGTMFFNNFASSTGSFCFFPQGFYANNYAVINTTLNMNNNSIINCPSIGGGGINTSDSIPVNTGGYNYLKKSSTTQSSVTIYGMSSNCFMFENQNGESAGCAANGQSDDFTIWTAGDGGTHCSWQDEDSSNSRVSYVNSSGAYVQVSTKNIKYSLKKKDKNNYDYLNRLNKINVYSYAYKYEINDDDDDKKKLRKYMKNKRYYTGLILEEIEQIYDNCVDKFKYFNINDDNKDDFNNLTKGYKPDFNEEEYIKTKNNNLKYNGINQTSLLCYVILSVQDLNKKLEDENKQLNNEIKKQDKIIDDLKNGLNNAILKINELITIINNTGDVIKSYL